MTEILIVVLSSVDIIIMNGPTKRNTDTDYMITDRCLKCGVQNHSTLDCRHKNQIQCRSCSFSGHKDYNCPNA